MKNVVQIWELLHKRVRDAVVCFVILLLPWQARYFVPGASLGGYPWEQGRWSLYVSMLGIALAAVLSWRDLWGVLRSWRRGHLFLGVIGMAFFLFPTSSWIATGQGAIQVLFLSVFAWLVYKNERLRAHLPFWITMSLIPVVFLAYGEFFAQMVPATKWLGLAGQSPLMRGPSVIELADGTRILRAYGSFSHPNILGGWLVFAMLLQVRAVVLRVWPLRYAVLIPFFFGALLLSFSRSAWMALFLGLFVIMWTVWRDIIARRRMGAMMAILVACAALFVFFHPTLIQTRIASENRLETRSINERTASIVQGWEVVRAFPFGTGFEAYRAGLNRVCMENACVAPLEPPHFVPLLVLAELGWARFVGLLSLAMGFVVGFCKQARTIPWELFACLMILGGLDHYLWSSWAGQGLTVLIFLVLWDSFSSS